MEGNSPSGGESTTIAFGADIDQETARKYIRALSQVGIKTDSLEPRVGAEIEGGSTVEV